VLLAEIAEVSRVVATTSARLAKIETLAAALREAGPLEVPIAVAYLSGELPQRQIGVGWAALRDGFTPAAAPGLTLSEVDAAFSAIGAVAGKGSTAARKALVGELFGRATEGEQRFLFGLLSGELRQGALEGVMTEAVARAASVPVAEVRRAMMLHGSLGAVAAAALGGGSPALQAFGLEVGRPVRPMLASSATSIEEALAKAGGTAAVEWKLDGIRIQAHLAGGSVRLFTRTLDEITSRLPDVVAVLAKLPPSAAVFDGELIALREDGRPLPFQDTASRTASLDGVPLSVFLFDVLQLDGVDLIDAEDQQRHAAMARVVPPELLMPRLVTNSAGEAQAFFADALAHGHEGVVVKSLETVYAAGRRGAGWIKVKPRHTLDLVVLAVEWGHGRRRGWLSNLHLGARDPETGGYVMLGKTFKGLTDELLTWQTQRLLALEDHRDSWTVYVRPELVVEIAFDGVQRSPRYPGGLALRFARVLRYREDKSAAEADTIGSVRALGPELFLLAALEGGGDVVLLRRGEVQAGRQVSEPVGQVLREARGQAAELAQIGQALGVRLLGARAAGDLGGAPRIAAPGRLLLVVLVPRGLGRGPPGPAQAGHRRHAGDAAAEHRLHLLLALEEVRDQLGDLADGDPGTTGDARAAGTVDDLRVAAFLRRHGPDDRFGPVQVLVVDLLEQRPVLGGPGQHAEQVPDRAELAHHGKLLDEILEREALARGEPPG
jgi:ATP-dependent DNA ligase I